MSEVCKTIYQIRGKLRFFGDEVDDKNFIIAFVLVFLPFFVNQSTEREEAPGREIKQHFYEDSQTQKWFFPVDL